MSQFDTGCFAKVSFLFKVQYFWLEFHNKICIVSTGVYTRNNEVKWWYNGNNTAFIIHYCIVAKLHNFQGLKNCPKLAASRRNHNWHIGLLASLTNTVSETCDPRHWRFLQTLCIKRRLHAYTVTNVQSSLLNSKIAQSITHSFWCLPWTDLCLTNPSSCCLLCHWFIQGTDFSVSQICYFPYLAFYLLFPLK